MFKCGKCREHKFEVPERVVLARRLATYVINGVVAGQGTEIVKEADYCRECANKFAAYDSVAHGVPVVRSQVIRETRRAGRDRSDRGDRSEMGRDEF